jgi:hypothetical protein
VPASYELFLRAPAGGGLGADELRAALSAHAQPGIRVDTFVGEGGDPARPRGVDLALTEDGGVDGLLEAAFALAQALGLEVYDPQLASEVTELDRDRVRANCDEVRTFRADTLGEAGLLAGLPAPAPAGRTRLHLWLLIGGIIVAFLLLARGCRHFV